MKEKFRGYYRPTKAEFSQLWENCLFVFDTNVILKIYRYSPNTRDNLIQILNKFSDRLWVPYQVALEYQKRRLDVIVEQESAYEKIKNTLNDTRNKLKIFLNAYNIHPAINSYNIFDKLDSVFKEIENELNVLKQEHPNLIENDNLRDEITELFEGKVGSPCSPEILEQIYKKGKVRYDRLIPPGFKDNKKEINEYGDLVLWFQIIEHSKSTKKPIIFITDDKKEDWWLKYNGEIIGPKPELINEIFSKAGENFYMYQTEQFMEYASKYLHEPVNQEAIDEVQKIRKFDEDYDLEKMIRDEDGYMGVQKDAFKLLRFFYDEQINKHNEVIETQDVMKSIKWNKDRINSAYNYLKDKQWLQTVQNVIGNIQGVQCFRVRLSSQGIDIVENLTRSSRISPAGL